MKNREDNATRERSRSRMSGIGRYITGEILERPRTLYIEVTMRCNARCDFCNYWQQPSMYELKEYGAVVKRLKPLSVIITGGEPLIRADLPSLISGIRAERPLVVSLLTNGRLLTEEKAAALQEAGLDTISVSLNHIGAAQDEERHLPGLFDHIAALMPRLARMGFSGVNLNTVLLDNNLEEVPEIIQHAAKWGVGVRFSCYSANKADNSSYAIPRDRLPRLESTLDTIIAMQEAGWPVENSRWYLDRIPEFYKSGRVRGRCGAGRKTAHVTPDGYIKPCPDMPRVSHYMDFCPRNAPQVTCDSCWYVCRGELEAPITLPRALHYYHLWRRRAIEAPHPQMGYLGACVDGHASRIEPRACWRR